MRRVGAILLILITVVAIAWGTAQTLNYEHEWPPPADNWNHRNFR